MSDAAFEVITGVPRLFYRDGRGDLPKDDREAARLYKLAADQGWSFAQSFLAFFYRDGVEVAKKAPQYRTGVFQRA